MTIFTQKQIKSSPVYAPLMEKINDLYVSLAKIQAECAVVAEAIDMGIYWDSFTEDAKAFKTTFKSVDDALNAVVENCQINDGKFSDWGWSWGGDAASHISDTYEIRLSDRALAELNKAMNIIVDHESKTSTDQAIEVARSLIHA